MEGKRLAETVITAHDKDALAVEVAAPPKTADGDRLELLILTSPVPCSYKCKVVKRGPRLLFALYQGKEKDNRSETRYKISAPATIDHAVVNSVHTLSAPLEVQLVNISRSGIRFRAPHGAIARNARISLRFSVGGKTQVLLADVVNHADNPPEHTEYGCRFLAVLTGGEKPSQ
jgi:hypothetical protein